MDFGFDETQLAVDEAVRGVLSREPASAAAWPLLCDAGLHILGFPEKFGGAGLGAVEVGSVARALGEAALATPVLGTSIAGLVASRAPAAMVADWCSGVLDGQVTAVSPGSAGGAELPAPKVVAGTQQPTISGRFAAAPRAEHAQWLLAPTTAGPVLVKVDARTATATSVESSLRTEQSDAPADVQFELTDARFTALWPECAHERDLYADLYRAVFLSYASGLLSGAVKLTASHLGSRTQFGRPLATFQAASQEIADIYVLATALESVSLFCNWSIDNGDRPSTELDAALFMFAGEGRAAMQMCHHLHGGLGVDVTYPMHRYFSLAKDVVRHCGGERHNLRRLGTRCSSL
ncbi:acyl-CoA dehydrogenase family protein [Nocardia africana]|uniref:acyl-CoA dehydrogenase family protein n=1 Tax=Nocardia africana TaxID=134964 RepID=UPI001D133511|nr:acyl-CoA dehydrogenase family protein [Nocardia africana]MCC3312938.1 acyl-CoA/acyl-ACP dehydrogenase [Nocardia africana]